jgi:HAD superfamily hydrolase (TIGR01549 family)
MPTRRQAVIFDMDGTLIRQHLDFDLIRREIGLGEGPVLEAIARMSAEEASRATAILERHEAVAAEACELQDGAVEVIEVLRSRAISVALMTRNSRRSVDVFLAKHRLAFDLVWTREDGPMKPSPEPIFRVCSRLDVRPADAWTVGDFHYDIICGVRAGAKTVLFVEPGRARPEYAGEADYVIEDLRELLEKMNISRLHR